MSLSQALLGISVRMWPSPLEMQGLEYMVLLELLRKVIFTILNKIRPDRNQGTELIRHEVIPVVGDLNKADSYINILDRCAIVVDTVADLFSQAEDPCAVNRILLDACTRESDPSSGKVKKTFIYTSGVLAYTHSDEVRDENTPATSDFPFVKARRRFEQDLLSHPEVRCSLTFFSQSYLSCR